MGLQKVYKDIKSLKIQGASTISTAGVQAIKSVIQKSHAKDKHELLHDIKSASNKLISARPTEPELENYLDYIHKFTSKLRDEKKLKKHILIEINNILRDKKFQKRIIARQGAKLIKPKSIVFTHCRSSTVTEIIKTAYKKRKFTVHNTETRPLYQGRITAKELSKAGIPVKHFVDSGARIALKNADIMLIGADSITYNKVYNKIGSEMMALVAKNYKVPVYICSSLWKFNPHRETIEERHPTEIWSRPPKGVELENYAFEKISFKYIKGIICEEGILKPKKFVKEARKILK